MARISLNSNIPALNAQRQLSVASSRLAKNFNNLSSGLRINRASDDAAGLSVSALLNIDKKVANQAIRNLNDGASYLNVAESALGELTNIVTRIGEISEQAANGSLGNAQRSALQSEVTALQSEYNRILESTKFNGKQLLTGDETNTVLQGGYGTGGQLSVQIGSTGGETTIVSVSDSGVQADAGTSDGAGGSYRGISGDGRYITFRSAATNLVSGDTNAVSDIFLRDTLTGTTEIVSKSLTGGLSNGASVNVSISGDGNFVSFQSTATNLIASDTNGFQDVFVRNLETGINELISVTSSGVQGNSSSLQGSVSTDGRYVAFTSNATNLVTGDINGVADIFLRDRQTGTTTLISQSTSGTRANAASSLNKSAVSTDGRYVTFFSSASNLVAGDLNGVGDIFLRDTLLNTTTRLSVSDSGTEGNLASDVYSSISADGRYVTFNSSASNLVSGDTNGTSDVFVRDLVEGTIIRVSTDSNGNEVVGISSNSSISADGKFISFTSTASTLVSGDTNSVADIFVKNTVSGEVVRASVDSSGVESGGASHASAISADGGFVTFDSDATNLVEGDTNGFVDNFLRDLSTAGVQEMSGMVVSSQANALVTLDIVNSYMDELSSIRAGIGASMSRIESFLNTLSTAEINYSSAISSILDADIAQEATGLVANGILQRAASSVLAQANQEPTLALKLLSDV